MRFAQDICGYPRGNYPGHRVWDSHEAILDACRGAWNAPMAKSQVIASIKMACTARLR
ncbi:MAG: hypothetical protein ACREDM_05085 [Methylocella sp.]